MVSRQKLHWAIAGTFLALCFAVPAARGDYSARQPTASQRYLSLYSSRIVVAEPLEQAAGTLPTRYRVLDVIHQEPMVTSSPQKPLPPLKKGQEFKLTLKEKYLIKPQKQFVQYKDLRAQLQQGKQTTPKRIVKALLFLDTYSYRYKGESRKILWAGVRLLTADEKVLIPYNLDYPKKEDTCHLLPLHGVAWAKLLKQVQSDAQEAEQLRALRRIADPAKKCQAILGWIENHVKQFSGNAYLWDRTIDTNRGWYYYEYEVPHWIYETGRVDYSWQMLEMADRHKNIFASMGGSQYPFHSRAGRKLLMKQITEAKLTDSLRFSALGALGRSFWRGSDAHPQLDPTLQERKEILAGLLPLLQHNDFRCRSAALECVGRASLPTVGNRERYPIVRDALDALSARYKQETHESLRSGIIQTLLPLADEEHWRKLSGNPQQMAVLFRHYSNYTKERRFRMDLFKGDYASVVLTGLPDLLCQRVENDCVVESLQLKTTLANDQGNRNRFPTWGQHGMIEVSVPLEKLPPGKWRIRARGKLKSGEIWQSEPLELTLQ